MAPTLDEQAVAALASLVRGPVLLPGDEGFTEEHTSFNLAVDHRPSLVVGATDEFDIQATVRFAAQHGLAVGVQGGRHQGFDITEHGVLITTGRMDTVHIDAAHRIARIAAGARWRTVVDEAAAVGLAPLNGSSSDVGVVGYVLGGGLSPMLGRKYGWAADHVRAFEIVTADGRWHRVTAASHPDLFWAVRGGKSNFGIVTAIELDLFPVTTLYGGGLYFDGAHTDAVLRAYRAWVGDLPDELSSSVALLRLPALPGVPEALHDRLAVNVRVSYVGSEADGERLVAPLRAVAPTIIDAVAAMPYTACDAIHQDPTEPLPYGERGAMLTDLTTDGIAALVEGVGPDATTNLLLVEIRHLGGALGREAGVPSAVGNRDAGFAIFGAVAGAPEEIAAGIGELEGLLGRFAPWRTTQKYVNFMSGDEPTEIGYSAEHLERLRAVKAKYDPSNLFRINNHNIRPTD